MRTLLCCIALACGASAALAEEHSVPEEFASIQAAVDAAVEGDVIVVGPGVHAEAVVAERSGITLLGRGATWKPGEDGRCLTLVGDGNVVTGFSFKGGTTQVDLAGEEVAVLRCTSSGSTEAFLVIEGAKAEVRDCRVMDCDGDAVAVEGDAALLDHVDIRKCDGIGIQVVGDDAHLTRCRVDDAEEGGVSVTGDGADVQKTRTSRCGLFGFSIQGDASAIVKCRAIDCGSEGGAGFIVTGDGNTVRSCVAIRCDSDGFRVEGDDSNLTRDRAVKNDEDGYDIEGGIDVTLSGCIAIRNGGEGVENGGGSTDLSRCRLISNRTDIALDGSLDASFGEVVRTRFHTGGAATVLTD